MRGQPARPVRRAGTRKPTAETLHGASSPTQLVRNEAAWQLRAGHSRTIGLVVLDVGSPFFTDLARGTEQVAADAGLSAVLWTAATTWHARSTT